MSGWRRMSDPPKTMRGVWLTGHGDLDRLEVRNDIPVPAPGPRDVLVRVATAGVNNTAGIVDPREAIMERRPAASRRSAGYIG